jgi:co-chaperonin GroES (HSP10)
VGGPFVPPTTKTRRNHVGEAKRKSKIREHANATVLINRMRDEIVELPKFERANWEAMPDMCLVRRDPERTVGLGQLAIGTKERQQFGTVEVSGIEWLKAGDRVLFSKYGGTDVECDDAKLVHLHRLQIYARKREAN